MNYERIQPELTVYRVFSLCIATRCILKLNLLSIHVTITLNRFDQVRFYKLLKLL